MKLSWLLLACAAVAIPCYEPSRGMSEHGMPRGLPPPARSIAGHPAFEMAANAVRRADSLVLYEVLPHPTKERDLFAREVATRAVVRFGHGLFYESPMAVSSSDLELLRRLCADADNFGGAPRYNFCGTFHADYGLEWQHDRKRSSYVFCFGCVEVWATGPDHEVRMYMHAERFKEVLSRYRSQRPYTH